MKTLRGIRPRNGRQARDLAGLKPALTALRESEKRYRELFENSVHGISQATPAGRLIRVNLAYARMYGYDSPEQMIAEVTDIGRQLYAHPGERKEVLRLLAEKGRLGPREVTVVRRDGTRFCVEVLAHGVRDGSGRLLYYQTSQIDITRRKQAEATLQQSEEKYRALVETANEAISIAQDGIIVFANLKLSEFLGVPARTLIGKPFIDFVWPGDRDGVMANYRRRIAGKAVPEGYDFRVMGAGGRPVWIFLSAATIQWNGRPATINLITDITERKRTEEALRESEEKFRAIADYTADWETWIGPDGKLRWVNPAVERLTGYSVAACLAMPDYPLPLVAEGDRATVRADLRAARRGTRQNDREVRFVRKDGTLWWGSVAWQPIRARDGTPMGHRASIRDITGRKQAEEERLAHLRFFESMDRINRVMQATNDLERMMSDVLDAMLAIFDCDRASLVYPCDPAATSWNAPMERTRPEYPGALALGRAVPMDPDVVRVFRTLQAAGGPVQFSPGSAYPLPSELAQRFGVQSQIAMALYPKVGKPWMFVQQQCSRPRVWTLEEEKLFEEIGRRLTDGLTSLLTHRNLLESETRLRALFENSMVGILLSAPDGRVLAANPAACRLFGRTEADICRLGRHGLVNRRDARINVLVQERAEKGYAVGEMTLARADGTCFPAEVASVVFETAEGPRTSMVIQDISERKLAEARLRDFSRKLLTAQEEEKRRISAVLHHDVGSITVGVTAYLNAIEEDLRQGKSKEALASLRKARRLFVQSVRRLKTLAMELRPPDLDILGLPAALRQHFSLLTGHAPLRIRFTDATGGMAIPPETQTVLFRVVQESLNNVVKHAHARQVRVRLSTWRKTLRLSIVDDGQGFNPARAAAKPGPHLGLRAVQEMVAALGGKFVVDAAPGRGTSVLVRVPKEVRRT